MFNKNCTLTDIQVEEKAIGLLNQMTLKEKVSLLTGNYDPMSFPVMFGKGYNPVPIETKGNKRLGITPIKFTDGPRGVVMGNSTCFPVSMARGASFDRDLERRVGDVMGKETRAQGGNYFAGICINLLRHPAWGRAQETYGEDPYHVGQFGVALTESVQEHNVIACPKHYALNSIENARFSVNIECDERTLREVYLPHFKKNIEAGAASIMGAYNRFRGDYCCESDHLLNKILRDEWGFEGFTSSDFLFGIRNTKKAIEAGMDLEMPMPIYYYKPLLNGIESGEIAEETLDTAVMRVLKTIIVFENTPEKMKYTKSLVAHKEHIELAKEVAEKSMVLIKNEGNVLPFKQDVKRVLVVGKLAAKANTGDHGSSRIYAPYVVTQLDGFKEYFGSNAEIIYCGEDEIEKAKTEAKTCDCVIIIVGNDALDEGESIVPPTNAGVDPFGLLVTGYRNMKKPLKSLLIKGFGNWKMKKESTYKPDEGLGGDRDSLSLKSKEINMIKAIGNINPNTVVTLIGGSMIMTHEWDDVVPSIVYGWYSGMEGGNALPRVLFGDVNPSGKLPFAIPNDESHLPYFSNQDDTITYGFYHGYTKLDKDGNKPRYPFGHGLSYTTYDYSNLSINKKDNAISISVDIRNKGKKDGQEVVQVYVSVPKSAVERQKKLLKGFEKISVKSGEVKQVTVEIPFDELRYYNEKRSQWELEHTEYEFKVGPSSDEQKLQSISIKL